MNPSFYLDRAALRFNLAHTADLAHHTDITLQDVPDREYTLRLFVDNQEIDVQKTGSRFWTPAQHQCALYSFTIYTL